MAKTTLSTDFQDDILNSSMGGSRRYAMTTNTDGTVSFTDASTYDQTGSNFGAAQINATNKAVNESADANKIIDDADTLLATTEDGYIAGAAAVTGITPFKFGVDSDGNYGYIKDGADTVTPFKSQEELDEYYANGYSAGVSATKVGTATAARVLTGYTFTNSSGVGLSGSMKNNGAVSKTITPSTSSQTYTIPSGYHNGSGTVTVSASTINSASELTNGGSGKYHTDNGLTKTYTYTTPSTSYAAFFIFIHSTPSEQYEHKAFIESVSISGASSILSSWNGGTSGAGYVIKANTSTTITITVTVGQWGDGYFGLQYAIFGIN